MGQDDITDNWKVIFSSHSAMELYGAKNFLESEGIVAYLQNELAAQVYGNAADKPKLLVKHRDLESATAILIEGGYIK